MSVAQERSTRCLDDLRARGHGLAQTAPAYLADWLVQGWLVRRLPPERRFLQPLTAVLMGEGGEVHEVLQHFARSLTSSRMRSMSQWALYDPSERLTDLSMQAADASDLTLDTVRALLAQSEIDFRTLRAMPRLRSVMMDAPTLTRYRHLAVREPVQDATVQREWLTPAEQAVLDALQGDEGWARGLRLEQERLPWAEVTAALREVLAP